jgi:hypothetical protein
VDALHNTEKTSPRLIVMSVLLAGGIFILDLSLPLGVAAGVPYVALVLISLWSPQPRYTIIAATAGTALTIFGYFLSPMGGVLWMVFVNRFLALFAIWAAAILGLQRKKIEGELRALNGTLERRVAERTVELSKTNKKLENENAERKRAEGQLVQAAKLVGLGQLGAGIAH